MHIAMIVDSERLMREHSLLRRVCIGLIDQGAQLTRIVPHEIEDESVLASERMLALVPRLEAPMKVLPWMRRTRARELATAMQRSLPDVIYAVGLEAWSVGLELSEAIERPIALDVFSNDLIHHVPRRRAAERVGGYVVPTLPMAAELRRRVDPGLVSLVPTGVAVPSVSRRILMDPEQSVNMAVIGSGHDLHAYQHVLRSLSEVYDQVPQLQVVLELRGPHAHDIWRELDRQRLRSFISVIRDASFHRSLITQCDVLLVPEGYGELNSLVLDGMAVGMAVIAREDPLMDMFIDQQTALLLSDDDTAQWSKRILQGIQDHALARRLGRGARELMIRRHQSSRHVQQLMETCKKITSGVNYVFKQESSVSGETS